MAEIRIKMLEVDLTREKSKVVDVTEDAKKHIGGSGLGAKLLWDMVPKGADPLGPENILYVGVGPMTGLVGTKTSHVFKSPQNEWFGEATVSGRVGREIIYAGYNAGILVTGKAADPSYLYVKDDTFEIRDAEDLWGSLRQKAEYTLMERLRKETGESFSVEVVGPAGENLVRYANISTEYKHSASTWGPGAVMGSKNLKALAVLGTKGPTYADHKKVYDLFTKYRTSPEILTSRYQLRRYGAIRTVAGIYHMGGDGIKNQHLGWHEICSGINYEEYVNEYVTHNDGCPGCSTPCFIPFFDPNGPTCGELRHGNYTSFLANVMVGFKEMNLIEPLVEELGLNSPQAGTMVAWLMDLYERGLITKEQLGGIDLKWGDANAICEVLKKIAYREGIGNTLAEGFKWAIPAIGGNSGYYAWHHHWQGDARRDPRRYNRVYTVSAPELTDTATICIFSAFSIPAVFGSTEECIRQYLNAVCGWDLTLNDLREIERRNRLLGRCFSLREGYVPSRDDVLSDRCFEETLIDRYGNKLVLDRGWYANELKSFYTANGLSDNGLPKRENLKRLGLEYVIPELDSMGLIS